MSDQDSLGAAKKLIRRMADGGAPSAEPFLPEVRTNVKWVPTTGPVRPFRPEAMMQLAWVYGVPFGELDGFHAWLEVEEPRIASLCGGIVGPDASGQSVQLLHYLGTYLHMDTGSPRYQTYWGLVGIEAEELIESALLDPANQALFDLIRKLRGYWSRDAHASDHRYGLARHFINLASLDNQGPFWDVTLASRGLAPF